MNNMGGGAPPGPQAQQPPVTSLIKPETIAKIALLSQDQKVKYEQGVTKLWETINNRPNDSPEYQAAYKKLIEVTVGIKRAVDERRQQANVAAAAAAGGAANQNGVRMAGQTQPQGEQRPQSQAGAGQPGQEQIPQKILDKVEQTRFVVPPQIVAEHGPTGAQVWIRQHKSKYAQALHRYEQMKGKIDQLQHMVDQRTKAGKPLNPQENENFKLQNSKLAASRDTAVDWLRVFSTQQDQLKAQLQQDQKSAAGNAASAQQGLKQESAAAGQASNANQATENSTQAPPSTSGPAENASKDAGPAPSQPLAANKQPQDQMPNSQQGPMMYPPAHANATPQQRAVPPTAQQAAAAAAAAAGKSEVPLQEQKVNAGNPPPTGPMHHGEPQPLKHEDALERARTFSQPTFPPNMPPSTSHAHPPQQNHREGQPNTHTKMPVPKELNIPPPQPVPMGQSRPTMTNGPMMGGPIGQPAMQKTPGYVLEGEGERILSKKKLQELVRQVTGGSGADDDEGEKLSADVEETLLDVADEFVDQVIVSACKLAKLRQSSTLELRDVQLILERNYNIRVPGFASDELRTVRKMQPAPAWTQKLSAVQAAKVTGGKGDL